MTKKKSTKNSEELHETRLIACLLLCLRGAVAYKNDICSNTYGKEKYAK